MPPDPSLEPTTPFSLDQRTKMTIYLLAKYYRVPRDPRQTQQAGYINNPDNYAWDETIKFARTLRSQDQTDHNVILDIFNQRMIKCNMPDMQNKPYDQVFAYYYQNYQNYFDRMFQALGLSVQSASTESTDTVTEPVSVPAAEEAVATSTTESESESVLESQ
jgi:hypothetical protein